MPFGTYIQLLKERLNAYGNLDEKVTSMGTADALVTSIFYALLIIPKIKLSCELFNEEVYISFNKPFLVLAVRKDYKANILAKPG